MPRKLFLEHLAVVISKPPDSSIKEIRRGEDDGSFILFYRPPASSGISKLIEITALIPELSEYPSEHQTYLYTSSANIPEYITSTIESLPKDNIAISQLIQSVTTALNKAVAQHLAKKSTDMNRETAAGTKDEPVDLCSEDEDMEWSDFETYADEERVEECDDHDHDESWSDDDDGRFEDDMNNQESLAEPLRPEDVPQIRRDLITAKQAGYKVGVLGDINGGPDFYISVAVRISKLGISDEAVSAWRLDRANYLILLIHYSNYYRTIDELMKHGYHGRQAVQFCVGTSRYYKPTLLEAIGAFSKVDKSQKDDNGPESSGKGDEGFRGLFISRPLNELLNSKLIELVKHRLEYHLSWDGAERFLADFQGRLRPKVAPKEYKAAEVQNHILSPLASSDALTSKDAPFPLVAMQFTLRHFVRCTEFCLVCHNRVHTDFEALKPYVCSNPLCLYQYMALGFGPSIEYEIISQPTVVDLLISFCYSTAKSNALTEFPTGMNLTVPFSPAQSNQFQAKLHTPNGPHELQPIHAPKTPLKIGEWVYVTFRYSIHDYYYRVEDLISTKAILSEPIKVSNQTVQPTLPSDGPPTPKSSKEASEPLTVQCARFDINFDDLQSGGKNDAIAKMLDTLPPVHQMKKWLEEKTTVGEQASLRNWRERISPAACGILRWIIASNRSCIVPVDDLDEDGNIIQASKEERVWGMGEWMQFRFAMGAPDKEQRFVCAVRDQQKRENLQYPTLYAFHGSPLSNWHSIIREGLHFKKTSHGRAYGNGCYHSLHLATSLQYSRAAAVGGSYSWRQSCLNVSQAVSLNEIVNVPDQFVAKAPHLVVDRLDWIQTRYLFIFANPENVKRPMTSGSAIPKDGKVPETIVNQDPLMTPVNSKSEKLVIPAKATLHATKAQKETAGSSTTSSSLLSRLVKRQNAKKSKKSKKKGGDGDESDSDASVTTEPGDRQFLQPENEKDTKKAEHSGQKILSRAAGLFNKKVPTVPLTDFVPGTLDMSGITLLPPPAYATSMATRRLQAELKSLAKVQAATPLHELGWYIDTDIISNVYQWIFEFHSFDENLPLAKDMKAKNITSIVLEARYGSNFPMSPPFVRVIKPRFLGFNQGGGGHVTLGGALCMELLTNSGWTAVSSLESVLLQVRMAITSVDPKPARLLAGPITTYSPQEAKEAYVRACNIHGWQVPLDFATIV